MRVLVCGSRTFTKWKEQGWMMHCLLGGLYGNIKSLHPELGAINPTYSEFVLIEGGATGADEKAHFWGLGMAPADRKENGGIFEHLTFEADWKTHGKAAGPIRNQRMLDEGKPTVCYAFIDKPLAESRGTFDMVTRCRKAGVPVVLVRPMEPFIDGDDAIPLGEFEETFGIDR